MVVAIGGLILVLGLVGTFYSRITLTRTSNEELDQRGLALARDLDGHAAELLLTNDVFGLYRRVRDLAANNADVRYIVVLDAAGSVRASTFANGLPDGLRDANGVVRGESSSLVTLRSSEGSIRDIAYPIEGEQGAVIRVGMTRGPTQSQIDNMTSNLLALTALALISGLFVAFFLATLLSRPLSKLADAARAVGRGESPTHEELYRHPEVGQVAVAFDDMTKQLREKEEERSQLLARVLSVQEEERRRISRELHDEAGQALTSVLLGLTHIEQSSVGADVRAQATELKSVTTGAFSLIRDMARDLRPSALDDLGLAATLSRYVSDYGARHGLETDFHASAFDGMRLPPDAEVALYRIAQEALTNVSRHAHASSVNMVLEHRDSKAVLIVEDDGQGFAIEQLRATRLPTEKLGILGMEERAALVGGILTIESREGAGTAIFVEVPLELSRNGTNAHPDS